MYGTTEKELIKKFNELFVLYRQKYLVMNHKGYITIENSEKKKVKLSDVCIARHLQGKETLGVFAGSIFTKFICFDVDVKNPDKAKWVVYKLVDTLQNVGIPGDGIYISSSGNKGYHVEIFFSSVIKNSTAKKFFDYVVSEAELIDSDLKGIGMVEFRPTGTQGVKLPLGVHFKTGNTCWYVDYEKGLAPIRRKDYILNIQPINATIIETIVEECSEVTFSEAEVADIEYVCGKYKPPREYMENIDSKVTAEAVEKLISEGLQTEGTRHNSLLKISKYFKHCGMNQKENEEALIDWLKKQDKRYYSSSWHECLKDISLIADWVYKNNVSLTANKKVVVSYSEMKEVLKAKGKNGKLLLSTMLVHSKRYAGKNGIFFMSYSKMAELTSLGSMTVKRLVKQLEESQLIEVMRNEKKILVKGEYRQETNRYKVNIPVSSEKETNIYELTENSGNTILNQFKECIIILFSREELKKVLTRDEFKRLVS